MQLRSGIMGLHVGTPPRHRRTPEAVAAARISTGFAQAIIQQGDTTRGDLEDESNVMKQCERVLPAINQVVTNDPVFGTLNGFARCWLCAFPVGHTSFLKYLQAHPGPGRIPITSLEFLAWTYKTTSTMYSSNKRVRKDPNNDIFDRATCEHVLPIKLAAGTLGLAGTTPLKQQVGIDVHTEYEYAHNYCNYVKNKSYFVTIPLNQTNFDNMAVNSDKVRLFVDTLIHQARGENALFMDGRVRVNGNLLPNIVQAYLFILSKGDAESLQNYKTNLMTAIIQRTQRMVDYIKGIDQASRLPDGSSSFYTHFQNTVRGSTQTDFPTQQTLVTQLQQVAPHYLSTGIGISPLQRSPSSAVCQSYEDCVHRLTFNQDAIVNYLENRDLDKSSGFSINTREDIAREKYHAIQDNLYLIDPNTGTRFIVEDIDDSAQGGRRNRRHKKTQRKRRIHKKRRTTRSKK